MDLQIDGKKAIMAGGSAGMGRAALFAACPDPDILAITIKPPKPNGDFLKVTPEQWRESIETALIGPIEIMRHYIPGMKERGWGRIVNIATFSAKNPMIWHRWRRSCAAHWPGSSSARTSSSMAGSTLLYSEKRA